MRNSEQIRNTIIDFANGNKGIRAVLLNGSRANPNIKPDRYQDYDITFLVSGIKNFTSDLEWTNDFGKKVLRQLPDEMVIDEQKQKQKRAFHCLMLFEDGVRIDLTLYPIERFKSRFHTDSLTIVWLDKDQRFLDAEASSEKDYFISEPTKKQFLDYCNEFWWVSTNVAKGLAREEIIYAKEMLDLHLRPVFMKMTDWYIGSKNSFSVSTGKGGKFLERFLTKKMYDKVLSTYAGVDIEENWQALFKMTRLFSRFAVETAAVLGFVYKIDEQKASMKYLNKLYKDK